MAKVENNKIVWENSEFPILCETCLGDNPYLRMTREKFGKECKICARPFTIFRWSPGTNMRFKKTEICQTCAKIKNVCQTCVLDLEYNLPTQVRDAALGLQDKLPQSNINKEYFIKNAEKQVNSNLFIFLIKNKLDEGKPIFDYEGASSAGKDLLKKLARNDPSYKRNRAHICSFFIKGTCTRGEACPYRHEIPTETETTKQNIKDRYYGKNDPVAKRIMMKANKVGSLNPPEDKSITSLFLTGIQPEVVDADIREIYQKFGEIKSIVLVQKAQSAFVNFLDRTGAENAAKNSADLKIKGNSVNVSWGRPKPKGPASEVNKDANSASISSGGAYVPPPPGVYSNDAIYPSQDPSMLGSTRNPN